MHVFLRLAPVVVLLLTAMGQDAPAPGAKNVPGTTSAAEPRVKVACLGDSITFGARLDDYACHAYPVRLGARLGSGYEVRGFGVSSRTLRQEADLPYAAAGVFQDVLEWKPDVAVIILGTNDTVLSERRPNWVPGHDFSADLKALVTRLRESNKSIQVFAATPPPMLTQTRGLSSARVKDLGGRAPRLARIASQVRLFARNEPGVEFVDLMRVLRPEHSVDGVHPNPFGADRIALRLAAAIRMPVATGQLPRLKIPADKTSSAKPGDFHGFRRLDFKLHTESEGDLSCILVEPERAL